LKIEQFIDMETPAKVPAPAQDLFQRKYRQPAPDFPHHVIAWHRAADGARRALCYIHFTDVGEILLGGGACSDDRAMRLLSTEERACVRAAGGLYHYALAWSVQHFAARFAAIFGYCGDRLAARVDLAVGFKWTEHEHLLVYFTQPIDAAKRGALIAKAHSYGAF